MGQKTFCKLRYMAGYSLKNLFRYRKRYTMFGIVLFILSAVFSGALAVYTSETVSWKTADFAMRLAAVTGVLLVILLDVITKLTIAVRQNELAAVYSLGISMTDYLTAFGFELLVFYGLIWLTVNVMIGMTAGSLNLTQILAGLTVSGFIIGIRLTGVCIRSIRKPSAVYMKEGTK